MTLAGEPQNIESGIACSDVISCLAVSEFHRPRVFVTEPPDGDRQLSAQCALDSATPCRRVAHIGTLKVVTQNRNPMLKFGTTW